MSSPDGGRPITATEATRRWDPWTPSVVAARLATCPAPWAVAGGWALDLFAGAISRAHDDIEITVPRTAFPHIAAAFPEYEWDIVGDGQLWPYPLAATRLDLHQTWLRDPFTGAFHLDVFREPHDGDTWICRRDPTITLPYTELIRTTPNGIPYLIPEVVLLFKAKANRPKDDSDFHRVIALLPEHRLARLHSWLTQLHPDHPWLTEIYAPAISSSPTE
ncbi:nucleotidyltransferase domain-containing protein [Nocardia sp. NPDC059195]|uniref:nucleotidyltransferase domain-containing protein n=1 Tax=Nocardia sp. NPDC059195 TaxID=3346765 RepID=UPI0036884BF0